MDESATTAGELRGEDVRGREENVVADERAGVVRKTDLLTKSSRNCGHALQQQGPACAPAPHQSKIYASFHEVYGEFSAVHPARADLVKLSGTCREPRV
jgi:hypothetical protein